MKIFKALLLWSTGISLFLHCADDPLTIKDPAVNFSIRLAGISPATPVEVDTVRIIVVVSNHSTDAASPGSLRVRRGDIAPLEAIALGAGVGKIIGLGGSTVLTRNDVVHLMRKSGVIGVHQAVFAAFQRTGCDERTEASGDMGHGGGHCSRRL